MTNLKHFYNNSTYSGINFHNFYYAVVSSLFSEYFDRDVFKHVHFIRLLWGTTIGIGRQCFRSRSLRSLCCLGSLGDALGHVVDPVDHRLDELPAPFRRGFAFQVGNVVGQPSFEGQLNEGFFLKLQQGWSINSNVTKAAIE